MGCYTATLGEAIDDRVAGLLVAGANITLTYDDATNVLIISSSGGGGGRTVLTAPRTYYVDSVAGSDANDGLAVASKFKTIQRAVNVICYTLSPVGHAVTIQLSAGEYDGVNCWVVPDGGTITIQGSSALPDSVVVKSSATTSCFFADGTGCKYHFKDLKLNGAAGSNGLAVQNGAYVTFEGLNFGVFPLGYQIALGQATVKAVGPYKISGGSFYHALAIGPAYLFLSAAVTLVGIPAFSGAYVYLDGCVSANFQGATYTGTATGVRYAINGNSIGRGANSIPTPTTGTVSLGGQYT